jgi:dTDP-glucose pyrophosphorylase
MKPELNVLVLMAGGSEAFADAGFALPKNLIEIQGAPVIQKIIENLLSLETRFKTKLHFVVTREECARYHTHLIIKLLAPQAHVIETRGPTAGAACTAMLGIEYVDNDTPLVVVNGDDLLVVDLGKIVCEFQDKGLDGGIPVFESVHPRWSYVKVNSAGLAVEAAEKMPISNLATAGVYYFRRGSEMILAVCEMIRKQASVHGQYYVCPSYNELILLNRKIGVVGVPRNRYFSLKTPQGLEEFQSYLRARREVSAEVKTPGLEWDKHQGESHA